MAKNFRVDLNKPTEYDSLLTQAEQANGLPEGSLKLIMMIENRNNPNTTAVSPAGAQGLMQIMPENQKALGVTDPNDPVQSIKAAGQLMGDAYRRYNGDVGAAIADYNGGPRAAERYLTGKALHPETAQYMDFARGYIGAGFKTSQYGDSIINAGIDQATGYAPSDGYINEEANAGDFITGLDAESEYKLREDARYYDLNLRDAVKYGMAQTMTEAISHSVSREEDENYVISPEQLDSLQKHFPGGLSADQESRIRNSRSDADFQYNLDKTQAEIDFGRRLQNQTGLRGFAAYAGVIGGGLLDPAALPLGTFGAAARLIRGGGVIASAGRMAAEGAAGSLLASPVVQYADKGSVSVGEVLQHTGTGAVFGAGLGLLGKVATFPGKKEFQSELETTMKTRLDGEDIPHEVPTGDDGLAVNFNEARMTSEGAAGEIIGAGPSSVIRAADDWDESVSEAVSKVQRRRQAWYGSELRQKATGWSDSENVQLARSKSKTARFVGAQWAGDAAGLGKQVSRNAAVIKEQMKDVLEFETVPALRQYYEEGLRGLEQVNYMAGGEDAARANFSLEVQLERFRHRQYRQSNAGSSKGYTSDAPANVQKAAATMDSMYGHTKELHMQNDTEHASLLKQSDHVGYIEQRPDFIKINKADDQTRKAFLDMVKDEYRAEATAKVNRFKEKKAEWIQEMTQKFESEARIRGGEGNKPKLNLEAQNFLRNPSKFFDERIEKLSKSIHAQMEKRASHWWSNAVRDPEARYQNSEASLITLVQEMSGEWFTGKQVDDDLVKSFQDALVAKWSDTTRREMNMANFRIVNGKKLHLVEMFEHDVFSAAKGNINRTAGRVAMAKLGWKTDQDIADTLMAMAQSGATVREVNAAKHISDIILNRAKGLDDNPLVQSISNLTHSAMMGKLGLSVIADLPTAVGNLGVGGLFDALGGMATKVMDGSMFVRNGRLTNIGSDMDGYTKGLMGHDNELWIPQALNADGFAMEAGGAILRRTAAAARFTNTMSGANAMSKMLGTGVTRASNRKLHKALRTGKGISEARLADVGLHEKEIARIKKQFDAHAGKEDFGLDKWTDPVAKETIIMAAHRFAQQGTMNKAYAGDLPQWTRDNVLGYLYSRFRSIGIKAQEKVLVRNLTLADSNMAAMMISGIAFATFLAYARIHLDAASSKDGKRVLKERLTPLGIADQVTRFASVLGLASEGTNLLQLMTGGAAQGGGDTPLTGAVSNITGAVEKVGQAATGNGEWSAAAGAGVKLLPGANTYQMMLIKKAIED